MSVKKKKGGGGGANWMDTYGDMVTLLLCFFVLLYSMSTISEEKWRAIVTSFNPFADLTATDPKGNDGPIADPEDESQGGYPSIPDVAAQEEINEIIEDLVYRIQAVAADNGMDDAIQVDMNGGKVYVKFTDTVFFGGNSFVLRDEAKVVLSQLCDVLDEAAPAIEEIRIQGHTAQQFADQPNETEGDRFLASNRATEVLVFIQDNSSIFPARLVSEGCGQWRPVDSNETLEGRRSNRRVEMIISGRNLEADKLGESLTHFDTSETGADSQENS